MDIAQLTFKLEWREFNCTACVDSSIDNESNEDCKTALGKSHHKIMQSYEVKELSLRGSQNIIIEICKYNKNIT